MSNYQSTKIIELGSCAFRQWRATHSHCKYLHGYQLKAKLWFGASSLDDKNWCVDFGGLKELKSKLQYVFDHTTTVAADDPELETFKDLDKRGIIQLRILDKGVGIERVAETVFSIADSYIKSLTSGRCWVDRVEVFEHEENSATFIGNEDELKYRNFVLNLKKIPHTETEKDTPTVIAEQPAQLMQQHSNAAHVGPNVSEGKGNWFAGTSWG
jgi:6-pyruvoyltetrahydropterin/6-carboxytetrahydropterin synthase